MNKLAIMIDNVKPFYENKVLFEIIDKIYAEDKNSSINIFVKSIDWPYRNIDYGLFKWIDYQNFEGPTIVMNFELLNYIYSIPHNNPISLYCFNTPFVPILSGKMVVDLLTKKNFEVYCNVDYLTRFMSSFRNATTLSLEDLIREKLYK